MPMNILVTSPNPQTSARNLDTRSVAQQLVTVSLLLSRYAKECSYPINDLYRFVPKNHPFVRWAMNETANIDWLMDFGVMLLVEYGQRTGQPHAGSACIYDFINEFDKPVGLEPKAFLNRAWDDIFDFRWRSNVYTAYKDYLCAKWMNARRPPTWGDRMPPSWYIEHRISRGESELKLLQDMTKDANAARESARDSRIANGLL